MIQELYAEVSDAHERIREIQSVARSGGPVAVGTRWPAIVLRTPKGWTGPDVVDGVQVEGTFRAHQVPLSGVRENPAHLQLLEAWLRTYRPRLAVRRRRPPRPELAALAPDGDKRMSATPYANGGRLLRPLDVPPTERYAREVGHAGHGLAREHRAVRRAAA